MKKKDRFKLLFVVPRTRKGTFWKFDRTMNILGLKAVMPNLGALTFLSEEFFSPDLFKIRFRDENIQRASKADFAWADMVFSNGMHIEWSSIKNIIERCNRAGVRIGLGGVYASSHNGDIPGLACRCYGEAEGFAHKLIKDLLSDKLKSEYHPTFQTGKQFADLGESPTPNYGLLKAAGILHKYNTMPFQCTRGCPFGCKFCYVCIKDGTIVRLKTWRQIEKELNLLRKLGWRGSIMIVDDNLIGHTGKIKPILRELIKWQKKNDYRFFFVAQVSINLAKDLELMGLLIEANILRLFIGLESPDPAAHVEQGKNQNFQEGDPGYLDKQIQILMKYGFQIDAGLILGFDSDTEKSFRAMVDFIIRNKLVVAMVGLLYALEGTKLWDEMLKAGRLGNYGWGYNFNCQLNIEPVSMSVQALIKGYQWVLAEIYDETMVNFYERCLGALEHLKLAQGRHRPWSDYLGFARLLNANLFGGPQSPAFRNFLWTTIRKNPRKFGAAVAFAMMGMQMRAVTEEVIVAH